MTRRKQKSWKRLSTHERTFCLVDAYFWPFVQVAKVAKSEPRLQVGSPSHPESDEDDGHVIVETEVLEPLVANLDRPARMVSL